MSCLVYLILVGYLLRGEGRRWGGGGGQHWLKESEYMFSANV